MKQEQHMPTLIGLLLLLIGLGGGIFLVENAPKFLTQASGSNVPKNISVVNITDTSFSVIWTTDVPVTGNLQYQKQGLLALPKSVFDVRDRSARLPRYTHLANVTDLEPNTAYTAKIIGWGATTDSTLNTKTFSPLSPPLQPLAPTFGTLVDRADNPVTDAIVLASFPQSQKLATAVDSDGNWIIPLGSLHTTNGARFFIPSSSDEETVLFLGKNDEAVAVTTVDNDSPLPTIRLGETYNLTKNGKSSAGPIIAQAQSFPQLSGTVNLGFQVLTPSDNAALPTFKPLFKGTGLAQKQVLITLSGVGAPRVAKTTVQSDGTWSWIPETPLPPGKYTASITSFLSNNSPKTVGLSFNILKSGSSVLGNATPAASLRPSPSPSRIATPAASATSSPPISGTSTPTIALIVLSLILLGSGLVAVSIKTSH